MLGFGAAAIRIARGFLWLVPTAFGYSLFWCFATAVYLLLRRDVDLTEFDEVHAEDEVVSRGVPSLGIADTPKEGPSPSDDGDEAAS
jgi:hypothetical protein